MARIRLQNLCTGFGDFTGLRDTSLDLEDAALSCCSGPSGCGRPLPWRMIRGPRSIRTSGRNRLDGVDVTWGGHREPRCSPWVFHAVRRSTPHESARTSFPLKKRTPDAGEIKRRIGAVTWLLRSSRFNGAHRTLSGGDRRESLRAAIGAPKPKAFPDGRAAGTGCRKFP